MHFKLVVNISVIVAINWKKNNCTVKAENVPKQPILFMELISTSLGILVTNAYIQHI